MNVYCSYVLLADFLMTRLIYVKATARKELSIKMMANIKDILG